MDNNKDYTCVEQKPKRLYTEKDLEVDETTSLLGIIGKGRKNEKVCHQIYCELECEEDFKVKSLELRIAGRPKQNVEVNCTVTICKSTASKKCVAKVQF
jgi:hypothetical protein